MKELIVPAASTIDPSRHLADVVEQHLKVAPNAVLFRRKVDGTWTDVTTTQWVSDVKAVSKGLVGIGVKPGDRVALCSKTRYEWTVCDYAIWLAGAVTVPIYETSSAEQIQWILSDSGAVAAIAETPSHIASIDSVKAEIPELKDVFQIDAGGLDDLAARGCAVTEEQLQGARAGQGAEALATIIYTSGTTGRPKGCELTHRALIFEADMVTTTGLKDLFGPGSSTLLFLPLAHVFARVIEIGCVTNRVTMGHTADIKNLLPDFAAFKPHFILSVPRVFEKVYNTAKQRAHSEGKGAIFDRAEKVAIQWSQDKEGGGIGLLTGLQHTIFDKLVYARLRAAMGGQVAYAVSGGAPLGARLGHFFRGIGVTVLEGYGLTESGAAATVNLPDQIKIGTVGRPVAGTGVKIAEDGEILLKGPNIFRGYWHNADATKEALEGEWFRTGDIGELDAEGFLKITGRKKELIVTAGGKNVAPAVLEDRLRAHPLVSQCVVVGDNQPFIGCLVTLDEEALEPWKKAHGKDASATPASLKDDPELRAEIQKGIDEANKAVSHAEAIKSFRILSTDFTEEGGQLTPSLKVKRNVVLKEFASEVDAIYSTPKE